MFLAIILSSPRKSREGGIKLGKGVRFKFVLAGLIFKSHTRMVLTLLNLHNVASWNIEGPIR